MCNMIWHDGACTTRGCGRAHPGPPHNFYSRTSRCHKACRGARVERHLHQPTRQAVLFAAAVTHHPVTLLSHLPLLPACIGVSPLRATSVHLSWNCRQRTWSPKLRRAPRGKGLDGGACNTCTGVRCSCPFCSSPAPSRLLRRTDREEGTTTHLDLRRGTTRKVGTMALA